MDLISLKKKDYAHSSLLLAVWVRALSFFAALLCYSSTPTRRGLKANAMTNSGEAPAAVEHVVNTNDQNHVNITSCQVERHVANRILVRR